MKERNKNNKKKVIVSVVSVIMAASLLLGGTYAWQSISQVALNEKSETINPGGRLHDDFNGTNKDIYVENFADEPIYARVRLDEYFEVITNEGTAVETTKNITSTATKGDTSTYVTHKFGEENVTDDYWKWSTGGSTMYMPTFNKNKDSLDADINGTYAEDYEDYVDYNIVTEKTANAVYDSDDNDYDDENVIENEETHNSKATLSATLMSMQEWIDAGSNPGNYWVYDTDGWVYWANAIDPNSATGLLLDKIQLSHVMDDSYYYSINVTAQFVTADDLGYSDNTGFYDDDLQKPSDDALDLLDKIGVDTGNNNSNNGGNELAVTKIEDYYLTVSSNYFTRYNYYTPHEPDFSKVKFLVTYEDDSTEIISATDEGVTFIPEGEALVSGKASYESIYVYNVIYKGVSGQINIRTGYESNNPGGLPSSVYNDI